MKNDYTIRVLDELIAVNRDGELGFSACAAQAGSALLRYQLTQRAQRCAAAAAQLSALAGCLGASSEERSAMRTRRRRWAGVAERLDGESDAAVLAESERGEDLVLEAYRNALDDCLPEFVHHIVWRQFEAMMSRADVIRASGGPTRVHSGRAAAQAVAAGRAGPPR